MSGNITETALPGKSVVTENPGSSSRNIQSGGSSKEKEIYSCSQCGQEAVKQRCSACMLTYYCNRDCQMTHWKIHKPVCKVSTAATKKDAPATKKNEPASKPKTDFSMGWLESLLASGGLGAGDEDGSFKNSSWNNLLSKWYEGLMQEEVYIRLIDSFRLRRDDDYTYNGDICEFYGGGNPLPDFKRYLKQAKEKKVLPRWWNPEHDRKITSTAMSHEWANVNYAVEKSDIMDHYAPLNKPLEHLSLRMLAEEITGTAISMF